MANTTLALTPSAVSLAQTARSGDVASGGAAMAMPATTIPGLLRWRSRESPDRPGYAWREQGRWQTRSWSEFAREVQQLAGGLLGAGLRPGGRLALWAGSARAWDLVQLAASTLGLVVVGIDERCTAAQLARVLEATTPMALVVAEVASLSLLSREIRERIPLVITLRDEPGELPGVEPSAVRTLASLRPGTAGAGAIPEDAGVHPVSGDHPATLIMTSGTTGEPKTIRYDHQHLLLAAEAVVGALGEEIADGPMVCWMPLCHLFQRMLNLVAIRLGTTITYVEDARQLIPQLLEIRPVFLAGVPRFFEKLKSELEGALHTLPRWRERLGPWALREGARTSQGQGRCLRVRQRLSELLVLTRLRARLGGRMRFLITGSAPTPGWLLDYFAALGVPLLEAYGTSENTVPIALNLPQAHHRGSVGRPLWPNQVAIGEEGEILVRGPGLYRGYADEPADTPRASERWTADGFYRTGDRGHLDADGFLFVTGRLRELIKTANGRRLAPAPIEAAFGALSGVVQVVVVGHGHGHLVGLLVHSQHPQLLSSSPEGTHCRAQLVAALSAVNRSMSPAEQVRAWGLLAQPLSVAAGEVTLNGKVRRDQVVSRHAGLIAALYADPEGGSPQGQTAHDVAHAEAPAPLSILRIPRDEPSFPQGAPRV